jgi:deoxyribodipyrimidine photolyase-related protein
MKIRLLLGDQLNLKHSWFQTLDPEVCYVMMEMRQETDYVTHHIQKVIAFFNAMRQFKTELITQGHQVHYWELDDPNNTQNLTSNLEIIFDQYQASRFEYLLPDEYRLDESLRTFASGLSIPTEAFDTEHFMTTRKTLTTFFEGKKQLIMEFFYRKMRKDFHLLMEGDQPLGGKWNFDKNNRNKWKGSPVIPEPYNCQGDVLHELNDLVVDHGVRTVGESNTSFFLYPASREQALEQLEYFNNHLLEYFGTYQDAMHTQETNLFHSRLSFALNVKILTPLEVVESVIAHYHKNKEQIELSQVEGFVRQIIGWREYMRGIYWREMPQYKEKNTLQNSNPLPKFYWTGNTQMNCLSKSIKNTLEHSYAHHIQRLMITGNFALLAQVHPDEVDRWYLGVYADAVEWVQLPNTRGMSQWADGGIVATKPYVSAAAYIHKMSNYCSDCRYNNKKRLGEDACPFNSLYWNFLDDKKEFFAKNNRMAMMLRLLEKIPQNELIELKKRAAAVLENPDAY